MRILVVEDEKKVAKALRDGRDGLWGSMASTVGIFLPSFLRE